MESLQSLDASIVYLFNGELRNDFLDEILPLFSETFLLVSAIILFLIAYTFYSLKKGINPAKKIAAFAVLVGIALAINNTITEIIKALTNRSRPYQTLPDVHYQEGGQWLITTLQDVAGHVGGSSFLSGHSSNSMVVTCVFIWFFARKQYYFFCLPLFVGWSRLYLGKHYLSDIICGWILGFVVSYMVYKVLVKYFPQYYGPDNGQRQAYVS